MCDKTITDETCSATMIDKSQMLGKKSAIEQPVQLSYVIFSVSRRGNDLVIEML